MGYKTQKIHLWRYLKWHPSSFVWLLTSSHTLKCLPSKSLFSLWRVKPLNSFTGQIAWEFAQLLLQLSQSNYNTLFQQSPSVTKVPVNLCTMYTPLSSNWLPEGHKLEAFLIYHQLCRTSRPALFLLYAKYLFVCLFMFVSLGSSNSYPHPTQSKLLSF